ncbi:hypothetical protein BD780_001131 [Clostridium tetanomorphum]|uniref:hypothetical protein n=2 Tax=Clostridium tetanomorphum TaxID=1553 RepID=UPI00044AC25C|nr:hypothetical protein [Clostridium tetanomorphum]KAJ49633.1 hypothetical protein CTM_22108 [Clostridium tetanomorphum DSM 665]KAJ52433.1 hypothetical protein CTM_08041 [Clostridium tetanomorphum DSM 665]MBP1864729.1 hypothetical protein [Clostridium tetanomorphum]NRS83906.1 hypothetical protein [Clostridium tetanomorphum]
MIKENFIKFFKHYIKPWKSSLITLIISMVVGFCFGLKFSNGFNLEFYKDDGQVLLLISIGIILITYVYIYYRHKCIMSHINLDIDTTSFKYIFYSLSFFIFALYYNLNKEYFFQSYSLNIFGIAQSQYIFIINFIGYFIITTIIYSIIFKEYSIKKIGKDGVEFETEKSIAEIQNELINQYVTIIDDFSKNMCDIDKLMTELEDDNLIRDDYTLDEFILLLDGFLSLFICENTDLSIVLLPYNKFDEFLTNELSYNAFILKKVKTNMQNNYVYAYENKIFVKYYLSLFGDYITIIIDCLKTYPAGLGELLYSYIVALETSYSKHLKKLNN